ncbi:hypothetical protein HK097_011660 [Rhizophlyctis rosea]|uniref:FAD-binding FR-type domain-containing protein n=1 Tax=Rhizophlyctis rosea TaxID=64517 RepID=A0AAD5S615_9FUNG|nr:hypothetical protein HK097_011660 [Rhizophlyctis rosea]
MTTQSTQIQPYHTLSFPETNAPSHNRPAWHLTWAQRRHRYFRIFSKPLIVLPSLGISIILGDLLFWTIVIVVTAAVVALQVVSFIDTKNDVERKDDRLINDSVNKVGTFGTILMLLALLPITHNSLLTYLFNLPFERANVYHRWLAYLSILVLLGHGAMYIVFYANSTLFPNGIASELFDGVGQVNLSGFIALCFAVALVLTSLPFIRRHLFEVFYRPHIPLFIAFVVAGAIHQGQVIGILAVPVALYAIDIFLRIRNARKSTTLISMKLLADGVVHLEFDKTNFQYAPGQYVFICIPKISPFEWHPYSISSSPHQSTMSVHIRALGNWSRKVAKLAASSDSLSIKLYVDGPYGELAFPLSEYTNFLMISGGIGVTPLQSVYNSLIYEWKKGKKELRDVCFVWSVREGGVYDYLGDEEGQRREEGRLGVLPPFHTPMLLERYESGGGGESTGGKPRIRTMFYLTGSGNSETMATSSGGDGGKMWVTPGRVDLDKVFESMRTGNGGGGRSAVLVCGPNGLADAVRARCKKFSGKEMKFDLHEENFDL